MKQGTMYEIVCRILGYISLWTVFTSPLYNSNNFINMYISNSKQHRRLDHTLYISGSITVICRHTAWLSKEQVDVTEADNRHQCAVKLLALLFNLDHFFPLFRMAIRHYILDIPTCSCLNFKEMGQDLFCFENVWNDSGLTLLIKPLNYTCLCYIN